MRIAIGVDLHKATSSAYAVYAGEGKENDRHRRFLDGFNGEFGKFPSTPENFERLSAFVRGHECFVLLENSTKAHEVYWVLRNIGMNVTVAHSTDLYRITKSVKKTDRNDSIELAGYMRRRLGGEVEFSECFIPSQEWMVRREMCRVVSSERAYLADTKRRIRAHMLLHGIKLKREYDDITCGKATVELCRFKDPHLAVLMRSAAEVKKRIDMGERMIEHLFAGNRMFDLIYSVVGIGVVTSAYLAALIVDIGRFSSCNNFTASFGVVPKKRSSGENDPNCATTHRGDDLARELLKQCAMVHVNNVPDSVVTKLYRRLVAKGKPKRVALIAASRSLLTVVWSVLKSGKEYTSDPETLKMTRKMAEGELTAGE